MSALSVREATIRKAVRAMADTLAFYRDAKWNDDYPGGIDLWPNDDGLDFGERAARTLRDPSVKRLLAALDKIGGE
jgi:hypothetical protein